MKIQYKMRYKINPLWLYAFKPIMYCFKRFPYRLIDYFGLAHRSQPWSEICSNLLVTTGGEVKGKRLKTV
jgi:hypothetical protein